MNLAEASGCLIVINCGRSSLKFAVFLGGGETIALKGLAERLGSAEAVLKIERNEETSITPIPSASHHTALTEAVSRMTGLHPVAIGHRVVHGGEEFTGSAIIDDAVIFAIDRCSCLAPLHNPANLMGVKMAREMFPDLPQPTESRYPKKSKSWMPPYCVRITSRRSWK